jgi:K+-transporting ATPase c subunit
MRQAESKANAFPLRTPFPLLLVGFCLQTWPLAVAEGQAQDQQASSSPSPLPAAPYQLGSSLIGLKFESDSKRHFFLSRRLKAKQSKQSKMSHDNKAKLELIDKCILHCVKNRKCF